MSIRKFTATGKNKMYYEIKDAFNAVGTCFVNWDMYYTAAHPNGLWLCGIVSDNTPIVIGLIPWNKISRMVVDTKNERVYVEVSDPTLINEISSKMYRNAFTHQMSDTGKMSFSIPMNLFSANLLDYIQRMIPTEVREELLTDSEKTRSTIYTILAIIALALVLIGSFL